MSRDNKYWRLLAAWVFVAVIVVALRGVINSATALIVGFIYSFFFTNPFPVHTHKGIKQGLKIAVVGLGFGISAQQAIAANQYGLGLLSASVIITVAVGIFCAYRFALPRQTSFLITSGTAICGGSAIAAVSPVIRADSHAISVALAIVFTLNSLALLIFPPIGHFFELSQQQFGLWVAIAIHDTSSVVGAALAYGDEAVNIATTLKLSRTLWIIPLAAFAAYWFKAKGQKISFPYFILGFVAAIAVKSSGLLPEALSQAIVTLSKHALVAILFLIGSTLSPKAILAIGSKPLLFAIGLWLMISSLSLWIII